MYIIRWMILSEFEGSFGRMNVMEERKNIVPIYATVTSQKATAVLMFILFVIP